MASLIVPLICALLYPVGTLIMKRAMGRGADLWMALSVNYWCMALIFAMVFPFESRSIPWSLWYQPAILGALSFAGQGCALKAVSSGDLTIATPALGAKVLLVALLTEVLLRQSVPLAWWIAAGFSFAAVFFLQAGIRTGRRRTWLTLGFSLLGAGFFSLGDVLIQKWAPAWGPFHFLPAMALVAALVSAALLPLFRNRDSGRSRNGMGRRKAIQSPDNPLKPGPEAYRGGWKWLVSGSLILGVQSLLLTAVIALRGQATLVNIVFSSRGLWNFLLVLTIGHWFENRERDTGSRVMAARLAGALLMFTAIVLAALRR